MREVGHDERQTQHAMWLYEKVTSLEREKEEMKASIKEMEVKIALQETRSRESLRDTSWWKRQSNRLQTITNAGCVQ